MEMLVEGAKEGVNQYNLDWVTQRMLKGETAIAKLIDSKVRYNIQEKIQYANVFEQDNALFDLCWEAAYLLIRKQLEGYFGCYGCLSHRIMRRVLTYC